MVMVVGAVAGLDRRGDSNRNTCSGIRAICDHGVTVMAKTPVVRYGYMCMIDFECELGMASGGNLVFPSIENLKENRACVYRCGIVKVKVELDEVIQEQDFEAEP